MNRFLIAGVIALAGAGAWWFQQSGAKITSNPAQNEAKKLSQSDSLPSSLDQAAEAYTGEAPSLKWAPEDNSTAVYEFRQTGSVMMDFSSLETDDISLSMAPSGSQEKIELDVVFEGQLHLKYFEHTAGKWYVAAEIPNAEYTVNGVTPGLASALRAPFAYMIDSEGGLLQLHAVKGQNEAAQGIIEGLLGGLAVRLPKTPTNQWTTQERDSTGIASTAYTITGLDQAAGHSTIRKQKLKYLTTFIGDGVVMKSLKGAVTDIKRSTIDITFALNGGGLKALKGQEQTSSHVDGQVWATGSTTMSAQLVDIESKLLASTFDDFKKALNSNKWRRLEFYKTNAEYNAMVAGLQLEQVIDKFLEISGTHLGQAGPFMVNYLRLHPELSDEFAKYLIENPGGKLDDDFWRMGWLWLAKAGHPEAQKAIMGVALNVDLDIEPRLQAIASVHELDAPEGFVEETIWNLYEGVTDVSESESQDIKTMSLYAYGTLGKHSKADPEVSAKVRENLVANLDAKMGTEDQVVGLRAIGNYGNDDIVGDLDRHLRSENPRVRREALEAMQHMGGEPSLSALEERYERETSSSVRIAALQTLEKMPVSAAGIEWAGSILLDVRETPGQTALVRYLGKSLSQFPTNRDLLVELLNSNPHRDVKKEIWDIIGVTGN